MTISDDDSDNHGSAGHAGAAGEINPRRRPGRPSLSNEALLDKAVELFFANGFAGTSIDAITAAAGMAKRTVYARYGDKTRLFKLALERAISQWILPIERLRALEEPDFERTLVAIGDMLVANVLSPGGLRLMRLTNAESMWMPEISSENVRLGTEPTLLYLFDLFERRAHLSPEDAQEAGQAYLNLIVGGPANSAAWGVEIDTAIVKRQTRFGVSLILHGLPAAKRDDDRCVASLIAQACACLNEAQQRLA